MLQQLARVAKEARLASGLRQLDIATAAGVTHETISRLERGDGWPLEPERIISAYEEECGLSEGELWKRAAAKL
jgi:transcriptional regulator with XRE-family HTH domain